MKRIGEGSGAKLPMKTIPSKVQRIGDTNAQRERDEQDEYLRIMERVGVLDRGRGAPLGPDHDTLRAS